MKFADKMNLDRVLDKLGDGEFVYTPKGGQPQTIKGVFTERYQLVDQFAGQAGVQGERPTVLCKRMVGVGTEGDTVEVDDVTYYVTGAHPFGDLMLLILSEDPAS